MDFVNAMISALKIEILQLPIFTLVSEAGFWDGDLSILALRII